MRSSTIGALVGGMLMLAFSGCGSGTRSASAPKRIAGRPTPVTLVAVTLNLDGVAAGTEQTVTSAAAAVMRQRLVFAGVRQANVNIATDGQLAVEAVGIAPGDAKTLLGTTADLRFKEPLLDSATGRQATDASGQPVWQPACLDQGCPNGEAPLSGKFLKPNASVSAPAGVPEISFEFDPEGAAIFGAVTQRNIGRPVAIFLDGSLITAPVVMTRIESQGQIAGANLNAAQLVAQLNAGALSVPIERVEVSVR